MAEVTADYIIIPNACRDVIGVRGVCSTAYPYYLDTLGVSLSKTAKLADSSRVTAQRLIEESVDMAWWDVFQDLRVDGFALNGIQKVKDNYFVDEELGEGTYTLRIERDCDIEKIYLGVVKLIVTGDLDVTLSVKYNGSTNVVYGDPLSDETLSVTIDNHYPYEFVEFTLVAAGTGTLRKTSDGGVIQLNAHTECDEKLFYCKYWVHLVKAVMYKAAAHILNASLFSDRYNDLVVYKREEIETRITQLDTSFNTNVNAKGFYQLEIENANRKLKQIVKQSYCTCCFECDNVISSHITIP